MVVIIVIYYVCKRNNKIMTHNISILDYYFFLVIRYIFLSSKLFLKIIKLINKFNTKCRLI